MADRTNAGRTGTGLVVLSFLAMGCADRPTEPIPAPPISALAAQFADWSAAVNIELASPGADPSFNTPSSDGCPFISTDGKSFYMASNRPNGLGGIDIWVSTRDHEDDPWGAPVNVGEPVNSTADDFCPTLARDHHTFYFVSRRQVGQQGVDWCGGSDIYATRLRDDGGFEDPKNLGCEVNSAADEFSPFPLPERADGPVLYFSSTRPGLGAGGDIYRSASHGGVFGSPELVPGVNSPYDDGQPNLRRDGLEIFFYSNRPDPNALGLNDLDLATRSSVFEPWSTPVNLGPNVNSDKSETRPSLSWDGTRLYFGSNRPASEAGSVDIYVTTREILTGQGN
jgi:hypothetical protein